MNYAIIAAGEGSRLSQEGVMLPKPLVTVHGESLIDRLIRIFCANGASSISVIVNSRMHDVIEHLEHLSIEVPLTIIQGSTPSSMHSFYELSKVMPAGKFCLATVDPFFDESTFTRYIKAFTKEEQCDGMFALTPFIDDEKPLYVAVDSDQIIKGFYDTQEEHAKYVSGGIYGLTSDVFPILKEAIESGDLRMRNFQRKLIQKGFRLKGFEFETLIDIDHASDIAKAHAMF